MADAKVGMDLLSRMALLHGSMGDSVSAKDLVDQSKVKSGVSGRKNILSCSCSDLSSKRARTILQACSTSVTTSCSKCNREKFISNGKENVPPVGTEPCNKTPYKDKSLVSEEPVTPTSNLKVLVSAASILTSALNQADQRRQLFSHASAFGNISEDCESKPEDEVESTVSSQEELFEYSEEKKDKACKETTLAGRKEKSLGLLCKRFMESYPEYAPNGHVVHLDDVANCLNIGRRRVYDIVNVLESIEMMTRHAKNKYIWFGKSRLSTTLTKLKALAFRVYGKHFCRVLDRFQHLVQGSKGCDNMEGDGEECVFNERYQAAISQYPKLKPKKPTDNLAQPSSSASESDDEADGEKLNPCTQHDDEPAFDEMTSSIMDNIISYDVTRRDAGKSLGILCQKFLMLFIVAKDHTVSLDRAAKLLIDEHEEGVAKYKTKVRRLYDIANILSSIGFLEKCSCDEDATKKTAYKWVGLDLSKLNAKVDIKKAFEEQEFTLTRHSLLCQFPPKVPTQLPSGASERLHCLRKLQIRSVSAQQLSSPGKVCEAATKSKLPRTFSATLCKNDGSGIRDEMVNRQPGGDADDGFDVLQDWSSVKGRLVERQLKSYEHLQNNSCPDAETSHGSEAPTSLTSSSAAPVDSPQEKLFKEKLRKLKEEFPSKFQPSDGLLKLLSECCDAEKSDAIPPWSKKPRRSLSSRFAGEVDEASPPIKKSKGLSGPEDESEPVAKCSPGFVENLSIVASDATANLEGGSLLIGSVTASAKQSDDVGSCLVGSAQQTETVVSILQGLAPAKLDKDPSVSISKSPCPSFLNSVVSAGSPRVQALASRSATATLNILPKCSSSSTTFGTGSIAWQQPAFLTIPASAIAAVPTNMSSQQALTPMIVAPVGGPVALTENGLFQIVPVQYKPVADGVADNAGLSAISAQIHDNTSSKIVGVSDSPGSVDASSTSLLLPQSPHLYISAQLMVQQTALKPSQTAGKSPRISPKFIGQHATSYAFCQPSQARNMSPTIRHLKQLAGDPSVPSACIIGSVSPGGYADFLTPPHVSVLHDDGKPPAKPIAFPKMTPETPISATALAESVLTGVTRRLMSQNPSKSNV